MLRLKSDYFRIEIKPVYQNFHLGTALKSDYFRIEMQIRLLGYRIGRLLKSDYFRIEIVRKEATSGVWGSAKIRLF